MNTFNDNFLNSWKDLQHAFIGFEFEFYSEHSFIKVLELLNNHLAPIEVWGMNQYHSDFVVTDKVFKIEPDYSGGSNMIELITGPTNWINARIILIKVLAFIKEHGFTDDNCSLHINISFTDLDIINMNPIKLILNFNEDFIYNSFNSRRNNIYAKSIKKILPFENWDNNEIAYNTMIKNLILPEDTKYYGINLQKRYKGWLEYRYIGGENYHLKHDDILNIMNYMILQTRLSITTDLTEEDKIKLLAYLDDNINWYKQYKTYDEFLANIDGIKIEYDTTTDYYIIKNNWETLKNKVFQLIRNCMTIKGATLNWNSTNGKLEVIDAIITNAEELNEYDFIDCKITNATLYHCHIIETEIKNTHIFNSKIFDSKVYDSKISQCEALEYSVLKNCMFDGKFLNCKMDDGVFRSGEVGNEATITNTVKMANSDTFWKINPQDNKKPLEMKKGA